jgi:hypothetical protein
MIYAHRKGGPDPDYDWVPSSGVFHWTYVPIHPGEYLAEIWALPRQLPPKPAPSRPWRMAVRTPSGIWPAMHAALA